MELLCCLLAEKVERLPTFNIFNVMDKYYSRTEKPVVSFGIALMFKGSPDDYGTSHPIRIKIVNEDAYSVFDSGDGMTVDIVADTITHGIIGGASLTFIPTELPDYGRHEVQIYFEGTLLRSLPLNVMKLS